MSSLRKKIRPIRFGLAGSLLFLPFLLAAAALTFPYNFFRNAASRRTEKRFADLMKSRQRFAKWDDALKSVEQEKGCIVVEWLSFKGPVRWWWFANGVADADLKIATLAGQGEVLSYAPRNTGNWQRDFTGPYGTATLIAATEEQKQSIFQGYTLHSAFRHGVNAIQVIVSLPSTSSVASD